MVSVVLPRQQLVELVPPQVHGALHVCVIEANGLQQAVLYALVLAANVDDERVRAVEEEQLRVLGREAVPDRAAVEVAVGAHRQHLLRHMPAERGQDHVQAELVAARGDELHKRELSVEPVLGQRQHALVVAHARRPPPMMRFAASMHNTFATLEQT